jgi:transcriptional regulator with XRE-family HTH domain
MLLTELGNRLKIACMINEELKQRREALGLTQEQLAEILGVDIVTISRWERGVRAIPPHLPLALESIERQHKDRKQGSNDLGQKDRQVCFVISPIGKEGTEVYKTFKEVLDYIIKPAIAASGHKLEVLRADEIEKPGSFIKDILRRLLDSFVVIADLTNQNPNVFYELGVRHSLSPRTILIAQDIEFVPSDLREYRVIIYERSFEGAIKFSERLSKYLKQIFDDPDHSDNPVLDRLPNRIGSNINSQEKGLAELKEQMSVVLSPEPEPTIKEKEKVKTDQPSQPKVGLVDAQEAATAFFETAFAVLGIMNGANKKSSARIDRLSRFPQNLKDLSKTRRQTVINQNRKATSLAAADLDEGSKALEQELPKFKDTSDVLTEFIFNYIRSLDPSNTEKKKELTNFRQTVTGILEGTTSGLKSLRSNHNSILSFGLYGGELQPASERMAKNVEGLIEPMEELESAFIEVIQEIDRKLKDSPETDE